MLAKILGNIRFYLLCASLGECASDQSAVFDLEMVKISSLIQLIIIFS